MKQLRWHPNGQLFNKAFYNEGYPEGEQLIWFINGKLKSQKFYKNGKRV